MNLDSLLTHYVVNGCTDNLEEAVNQGKTYAKYLC
jgi:hypothetical protein